MASRFERPGLEEWRQMIPEKAREKAYPPMSELEAKRALDKIARSFERIALPYRKAGDKDATEGWEERAETIRHAANKETLDEHDVRTLLDGITYYEGLIARERDDRAHPPNKRRFNDLSRISLELVRLRDYLDRKPPAISTAAE